MGASKQMLLEEMESWCGECGNELTNGICHRCEKTVAYSEDEYSKSCWWITCNHIPSKQRPCKYTYSNGAVHYGFQCMTCGRFSAKSKKSFGLNLPSEWIDETVKERFRLFNEMYSDAFRERMRIEASAFFDRFPFENWRDRYEAYIDSEEWENKSIEIKERNPICQECNKNKSLHVHHKIYARMGFELDRDLIAVCYECHSSKHEHMKILEIDWEGLK
jgi:hypothetical protein